MASHIEFVSDGRRYEWHGGYGAVLKSFERGVAQGQIRAIERDTFTAWRVYPRVFRAAEIWWSLHDDADFGEASDRISALRRRIFSV